MIEQEKYFYVVSFTARSQAGVAIIIATDESSAFSVLQHGGLYNGHPEDYEFVRARNVGKYCGHVYGLMLESYTNALVAYDAIVSVADKIIGPVGPTGPEGPQGETGPMCEVRVGTVSQLPIGSYPTVTITKQEWDDYYTINFGIPKYDISPESLAALKIEMTAYIDAKFQDLMASLNLWKGGVESEIAAFKLEVNGFIEDNERVLANALIRHEAQLNS